MEDVGISVKLSGWIKTNSLGLTKLLTFYEEISAYRDTYVQVDFSELKWIDANMSALLNALEYKLEKENNIKLFTDMDYLANNFSVLFRNGALTDDGIVIRDTQLTTLPFKLFFPLEQKEFAHYVNEELMKHRGLAEKIDERFKNRIKRDLIEISTNIYRHAQTTDPFFVCGQYYPQKATFIFTMVDVGVGFLKPIQNQDTSVKTDFEAIKWALNGNTTKSEAGGGLGLSGILDYFQNNRGDFHICTGNSYWTKSSELGNTKIRLPFKGTFVSLCFNY
ncbi:hypothetical protein [Mucilaginibacter sp. 10B2]|uniref:hypothetical protein n=1 Tax=Mucilaginibacter sp. 10B2 TaxID=3048574 RepID=UPI002B226052|nr:hypothetical protein [Mucilaginibacter sp. 10B2]MEB0279897.1 hypothetical protein [Mucilaginibacter sp. 10B2]